MGLLSNLLRFRDGRQDDDRGIFVRHVSGGEIEQAVKLILSPPGGHADSAGVLDFIHLTTDRGIDLGTIMVAEKAGKIVSAMLPVTSPGRTMLMLCPSAPSGKAAETGARLLIEPICRQAVGAGVQLAQALIEPTDSVLAAVFGDHGFMRMAELQYLQVMPASGIAPPALPEGMRWVKYSEQTHEQFGRTVIASYQGSLDCPALNGLRSMEDILAGHKASGIFDPDAWHLLMEGDRPLGVLLLCDSLRNDAMELVYLGLLPAARGRKLGELMMKQAMATAGARGHGRLCLAVDARNTPALKLYYRHGMARIGSKLAMLRDLRTGSVGH